MELDNNNTALLAAAKERFADGDEEVHRVLITKIFPRQADVMTVDEWNRI